MTELASIGPVHGLVWSGVFSKTICIALIAAVPVSAWAQISPTRYEAEDAVLTGVLVFSGRGSSGGQYADFQRASGDAIEWTVVAQQSGTHTFSFGYSLGAAAERPLRLTINGSEVAVSFPSTGSWAVWSTSTVLASLFVGTNTVRLEAIGSSGANFDYLDVGFRRFASERSVPNQLFGMLRHRRPPAGFKTLVSPLRRGGAFINSVMAGGRRGPAHRYL